jgi:hypothetical protein
MRKTFSFTVVHEQTEEVSAQLLYANNGDGIFTKKTATLFDVSGKKHLFF